MLDSVYLAFKKLLIARKPNLLPGAKVLCYQEEVRWDSLFIVSGALLALCRQDLAIEVQV